MQNLITGSRVYPESQAIRRSQVERRIIQLIINHALRIPDYLFEFAKSCAKDDNGGAITAREKLRARTGLTTVFLVG